MAEIKSHGLMGLPHYRNSRVSMALYEPIYKNKFTVQITLPPKVAVTPEDNNLILEGVKSIDGLNTWKNPKALTQQYKFADRSFAEGKPDNTYVDLTLQFELNLQYNEDGNQPTNYTIKTLRRWTDLIFDPLTGAMSLKRDYVAPNMTVTMYDRGDTPIQGWIFYNLFPHSINWKPDLKYNDGGIMSLDSFQMRADYWDEVIV